MTDEHWSQLRRLLMFVIGAAIILGEVFTGDSTVRPLVIALGLVLMGIVSIEQIVAWVGRGTASPPDATVRRSDGSPVMQPEKLEKPEKE